VAVARILGPMKISLAPNDPLGEALHFVRMTGVLYCRAELTPPWALALPAFEDCLMFHVVTLGRCLLEVEGCEEHVLQSGQFALVPHSAGHQLTSEHGVTPVGLFELPSRARCDSGPICFRLQPRSRLIGTTDLAPSPARHQLTRLDRFTRLRVDPSQA
jgi:Cupin